MISKTLYHVTTPRKLERYQSTGRIIKPVRGFTTLAAARDWAAHTGRTVIIRVVGSDCHKLPDHHQPSGDAWWIDHDVPVWDPVYARAELRHWSAP